ncbi:hypothetical protein UPYG_G00129810 [Umbra pygmaea]|uniref:C-type lectin domain-containing protein n=1 Tax=Umbra pygmaea TaxID=75934 RepID=A0ABD0X7J2_UMBPY
MRETVFLIILLAGLNLASCLFHQYHFVNMNKTWSEAQSYCRETYTDLATISDQDDYDSVNSLLVSRGLNSNQAWIGLKYDSWRWSLEDTETDGILNGWPGGYPLNTNYLRTYSNELQECVFLNQNDGSWVVISCTSNNFYFVCYDGRQNATQTFVLVNETKTWYEAQSYCRENYTDLAIVRNPTENQAILNLTLNLISNSYHSAWIGLYRNKTWSDGSNSMLYIYSNTAPPTILNYDYYFGLNKSCFMVQRQTKNNIEYDTIYDILKSDYKLENCENTFPFFCYSESCKFSPNITHQYYLVNQQMTWTEAQSYCRENHTDLATVSNSDDYISLTCLINSELGYSGQAWIGLKVNVRWSLEDNDQYAGNETEGIINVWSGVYNLLNGESYVNGQTKCTYLESGEWELLSCDATLYFVCYDGRQNATKTFVLVEEYKTWYQAQSYCRKNYTDLAIVRNQTDNDALVIVTQNVNAWIGLYFDGTWSDNLTNDYLVQFNGLNPSCGTANYQNLYYKYYLENCNDTFAFVCYSDTTIPQTTQPATTPPQDLSSDGSGYIIVLKAQVLSQIELTHDNVLLWIKEELKTYGLSQTFNIHLIDIQDVFSP